jgi:hypothetical protein
MSLAWPRSANILLRAFERPQSDPRMVARVGGDCSTAANPLEELDDKAAFNAGLSQRSR